METITLPPIPSIVARVLKFDPADPKMSSLNLESIVSPDEAISSRLLMTANSAYYGRSRTVRSIRDAINLIGLKETKNVILMMSLQDLSAAGKGKLFRKYLREYPVLTAMISSDLCKPSGKAQLQEDAFLSGLLSKIGMAVIGNNKFRSYEALLEQSEKLQTDLLELERKSYGVDQREIGMRIADEWNFPDGIVGVLREQGFTAENLGSVSDLTRITTLGSLIAKSFHKMYMPLSEKELAYQIFEHYDALDAMPNFYSEEYHEVIQSHPFYLMVSGG